MADRGTAEFRQAEARVLAKLRVIEHRLSEDIDSVARAIDVVGVAPSDQVFLRCRQLGAEYARFREPALPSWAFGVALTAGASAASSVR